MASTQKITTIERIGVYGLLVGLLVSAIVAAFSVGGVLSMSAVKIFLNIAGIIGVVGIILATAWHRNARGWIRTCAAVVTIGCLAVFLLWLYRWIDKNGVRPPATVATVNPSAQVLIPEHPAGVTHDNPSAAKPKRISKKSITSSPDVVAAPKIKQKGGDEPPVPPVQAQQPINSGPVFNVATNGIANSGTINGGATVYNLGNRPPPPRVFLKGNAERAIQILKATPGTIYFTVIGTTDELDKFWNNIVGLFTVGAWHAIPGTRGGSETHSIFGGPQPIKDEYKGLRCFSPNWDGSISMAARNALTTIGFACPKNDPSAKPDPPLGTASYRPTIPDADFYITIGEQANN